jgi:hypothetical protein
LLGGFAGGFVARAYPLAASLWIGGLLQASANLAFSWQAIVGHDIAWLTFAITAENFTSAIGTVIYVAYLSALCRNPLHTATQYALLTALAAVGRTYLSAAAGYIAEHAGLRRRGDSEPRAARGAAARRAFQDVVGQEGMIALDIRQGGQRCALRAVPTPDPTDHFALPTCRAFQFT